MGPINVSVVIGSVRQGRMGLRVGRFLQQSLEAKGLAVHLIDPVELDLPLLRNRYAFLPENEKTAALHQTYAAFEKSDAIVVATPEYNHSFSPVIGNTLNYFYHSEFYYKVGGIATYSMGGFGGVRAGVSLRTYLGELGIVSIPKQLPFPVVQNLLNEDGTLQASAGKSGEAVADNAEKFADELAWYAKALKEARVKGTPEAK
ncbi:hypothetical protein LEN26_011389 [Aphanomyces euteiches]|nr:hypothetical protein AeMF1_015406 [Aphanomyces euteiches]KAH9119860.1 hypothetical protein LEN26_011389 [Aphanomyces euteiches]KAH9183744.1 hypothetical protein AeNC1_014287 [Aphanomyces euteiches]